MNRPWTIWPLRIALLLIVGEGAAGTPLPATDADWQAAATVDLTAIHDLLRDNSPAPFVERDSSLFRAWLDSGYSAAQTRLQTVHDRYSYLYLLRQYAGGFRDMHIVVWPVPGLGGGLPSWPGFTTAWKDGAYVVATAAESTAAPPLGSLVVGCDGSPVATLARARLDTFEANLDLEGERVRSAYALLWDLHNPYVVPLHDCSFRSAGTTTTYHLDYRPIDAPTLRRQVRATQGPAATFGVRRTAPKQWRIGLPGLTRDYDWPRLYATVEKHLTEIRQADRLIIDVRGNDGGLDDFEIDLAMRLWGAKMVDFYYPDLGPFVYRISPERRQEYADSLAMIESSVSPEVAAAAHAMLNAVDAALAAGQHVLVRPGRPPVERPPTPPPNPLHAQVLVLTDFACGSACLDLLDLYLAFPNVVQVGRETNADTIFMGRTTVTLPSTLAAFGWGERAWIERPRGSWISYRPAPSRTYRGDPDDTAAVENWLQHLPLKFTD